MNEKRYDRDEVSAILRRSAEIEGARFEQTTAEGLSLRDLEGIARDSGMDPASVRAAAGELAGEDLALGRVLKSVPARALRLQRECTLDGELEDVELERLLRLVEERLKVPGQAMRTEEGWQWSARPSLRKLRASVRCRDGRTEIEIEEDLRSLASLFRGGIVGGFGLFGLGMSLTLGVSVLDSLPALVGATALGLLASLTAGFWSARAAIHGTRENRDQELQRLVAELGREGQLGLARAGASAGAAPVEVAGASSPTALPREGSELSDRRAGSAESGRAGEAGGGSKRRPKRGRSRSRP